MPHEELEFHYILHWFLFAYGTIGEKSGPVSVLLDISCQSLEAQVKALEKKKSQGEISEVELNNLTEAIKKAEHSLWDLSRRITEILEMTSLTVQRNRDLTKHSDIVIDHVEMSKKQYHDYLDKIDKEIKQCRRLVEVVIKPKIKKLTRLEVRVEVLFPS